MGGPHLHGVHNSLLARSSHSLSECVWFRGRGKPLVKMDIRIRIVNKADTDAESFGTRNWTPIHAAVAPVGGICHHGTTIIRHYHVNGMYARTFTSAFTRPRPGHLHIPAPWLCGHCSRFQASTIPSHLNRSRHLKRCRRKYKDLGKNASAWPLRLDIIVV